MTNDLTTFIQKYATSYDPDSDTYRRPPFAQPVKAGKNSPIYNAHSYHTKVPPEGIVPYIEHYTNPGDLILDPFCGSGMTGVAALMTSRNAILNDLSPAAVHIARNYTTPVDIEVLKQEFEWIKRAVKEEFEWLYGTVCDHCDSPATIQYIIWSDVFDCGRCGKEIILWDVAVNRDTGSVAAKIRCPNCEAEWRKPNLRWVKSIPVLTNYECRCNCCVKWRTLNKGRKDKTSECGCKCCRTGRAEHRTRISEIELINQITGTEIKYWYPKLRIDRDLDLWYERDYRKLGIYSVDHFYTSRNLRALARLWYEINAVKNTRVREALRFAFTNTAWHGTKMRRFNARGGDRPLSGTLYVPSLSSEANVLSVMENKIHQLESSYAHINSFQSTSCTVHLGSATNLSEIPDNIIDYIYTDPPFGSNLIYSDLSIIWESWLNEFTDVSLEAVIHRRKKGNPKTLEDYADIMAQGFREMFRVLKPGHWASIVFHNTDDKVLRAIQDGALDAGFDLVNALALDKKQGSVKQYTAEGAANFDIVLNLQKPQSGPANGTTQTTDDLEKNVIEGLAAYLATNPPSEYRVTQYLHSYAIRQLYTENIAIEKVTIPWLEGTLPHYFKKVDDRWYLRGEQVVEGGLGLIVEDEASTIAWLTRILSNEPQEYGDLLPQWQMATLQIIGKIGKSLEQILIENFWQDKRTGRWRIPTPTEREKMSARVDLSAQAHLRVIRRYLAGELERQPNHQELAAWLRFCYSREFFSEAAQLFPHIDDTRLDPAEYKAISRMATVSKMRVGENKGEQN